MRRTEATLAGRVQDYFESLQVTLCEQLARMDGAGSFRRDEWKREGGGGGISAVLADGALFEKAGVNTSTVWGEFDDAFLKRVGGTQRKFTASGISLVLHPLSPMVPTAHANLRYLTRGDDVWFGGGSDLTPSYPNEEDTRHFHRSWKAVCDRHDGSFYERFKRSCDEYFYIPHRGEMRGVGGIFFDDLRGDLESIFAFVRDCGDAFLSSYAPIVKRRRGEPFGERERAFQLYRRGRYVEFNLVYDRGTSFGLATHGRAESILMSLPPLARWEYCFQPQPGSREAAAAEFFQPRDWV
ncbi:MAG: oxygen-dependent coproporphyrinogen oxidase [Candidatus Eremiobacteraeota bacterium]|nr:oxygen-dependent coproporphyrinogen oxidase [Candidatus Eremiobacteraeota bacterium]MBC5828219.1 oxygen-dependent coproporphyrinogen oxidase [Candidatus Eremiobacteraeota bacterium]